MQLSKKIKADELRNLFDCIDINSGGEITFDELLNFMSVNH